MGVCKDMHIGFCLNELKRRETELSYGFAEGLQKHGHDLTRVTCDDPLDCYDLVCIIGVKSMNRMAEAEKLGVPYLYFDKGYSRKAGYWRVSINSHQPTRYFNTRNYPDDRRKKFGWRVKDWKKRIDGNDVLFAGSSEKFHVFSGLSHPTDYAIEIITQIRQFTKRRIIYRPKPSWKNATPIKGTAFSREKGIGIVLDRCGVLVTHTSSACFEALLAGIPTIVLGNAITRDVSSTTICDINDPLRVSKEKREQLLNNLAYCQFTPVELKSGDAWDILRHEVERELS